MSTSGMIGEEIDKQAALASEALRNISGVGAGTSARQLLPRAVLDMLGPYSAANYFADRVVQSATFDAELAQAVRAKLLPLESMADESSLLPKSRATSTIPTQPSRFDGWKSAMSK